MMFVSAKPAGAQLNVVTYHYDNGRTGQNPNETILTPANVNKAGFGFRFSQAVDGYIVGQPLYLSNVAIPGAGTHNVVYVATLNDSVYAFDADSNTGANAAPLWQVNFTNPAAGITTASGTSLPCQAVTAYTQAGIVSTPVIDISSGTSTATMYIVAKTNENGTVVHRLHALDVTTGAEKFAPAVAIGGTFTANDGTKVTFNSLHAMNRPALLLNNGIVYIAFGSNGCNDSSYGWVLAYNAATLTPAGIFNTAPKKGLGSIWFSGSGPAADSAGAIYVSTAEAAFDGNSGGQDFGSSVLKLVENAGTLARSDYFTPFNQSTLSQNDLDLSASGLIVLPDQVAPTPLLVASGKQGTIYVLNRNNLGQYNPTSDMQIVQEIPKAVGEMFSTPAYWNNTVYFSGASHPIEAYPLNNGLLGSPTASISMAGLHAPTVSANKNSNGVLWVIGGKSLWAFDAVTLAQLYYTNQNAARDALPPQPHFSTQMVANGKVYVGTQTNLMAYGLLDRLTVTGGNNQSQVVTSTLSTPLTVQLTDPYSGQAVPGVTVTFTDGGAGGVFSNPSVVTDSNGNATTGYTFSKVARIVTITASNPSVKSATFTETATPLPAKWLVMYSGGKQSALVTTTLPAQIVTKVADQYGNGIVGWTVTYTDNGAGGSFSAIQVTTSSAGKAPTNYTTSTKAQTVNMTATATNGTTTLAPLKFLEIATAGPPSTVNVVGGNNQTAPPSTALPQPLSVQVFDQYGNAVSGASVAYNDGGAGGTFSMTPVASSTTGQASTSYTMPANTGTIKITAQAGTASATFTETSQ